MGTIKPFDGYKIRIYGGDSGRAAFVACYSDHHYVGLINFYPDGAALPDDYLWHPTPTDEYVILHMPASRLDAVLSTLRQERPLYLSINANRGAGTATSGMGFPSTSDKEPVGEEEGTP